MITAQRIEQALLYLAGLIAAGDDAFAEAVAPIYDRLEREHEACRDDIRARALRRIEAAQIQTGEPR